MAVRTDSPRPGQAGPGWTVPYWALATAACGVTWLEKGFRRRLPFNREDLRKLTQDAWFSSDRIHTELGFEPGHNLEEEIPRMVREYLDLSVSTEKLSA